jgi:hypothetical protein
MKRTGAVTGHDRQATPWAPRVKWIGAALIALGGVGLVLRVVGKQPHWAVGGAVAGTGAVVTLGAFFWGSPKQVKSPHALQSPQALVNGLGSAAATVEAVDDRPPVQLQPDWVQRTADILIDMAQCGHLMRSAHPASAVGNYARQLAARLDREGILQAVVEAREERNRRQAILSLLIDYPRLTGGYSDIDGTAEFHRPLSDLELQISKRGLEGTPGNADDIEQARTHLRVCQEQLNSYNAQVYPLYAAQALAQILRAGKGDFSWVVQVRYNLAELGYCERLLNDENPLGAVRAHVRTLRECLKPTLDRVQLNGAQQEIDRCHNLVFPLYAAEAVVVLLENNPQ